MSKSNRIKANAITSRAEFDSAVDQIARLSVELRLAEASRDEAIQTLTDLHSKGIGEITTKLNALASSAEVYATANRKDLLPATAKSVETPLATYGFRLGQPTLALISRKFTWAEVLTSLKARGLRRFIRTKYEVDKDTLKAKAPAGLLKDLGCQIVQEETFFVEPKDQPTAEPAKVAA